MGSRLLCLYISFCIIGRIEIARWGASKFKAQSIDIDNRIQSALNLTKRQTEIDFLGKVRIVGSIKSAGLTRDSLSAIIIPGITNLNFAIAHCRLLLFSI